MRNETMETANMVTLENLVRGTAPGQKRIVSPESSAADEIGSFFIVRPNYKCRVEKFHWENQPELSDYPRRASVNAPKRSVDEFVPFTLTFDGPLSELVDYYDKLSVSFISSRLLHILREFDPDGIDAAPAPMTCEGQVLDFHAFMPQRAFIAADLETAQIEVRTRVVSNTVLASFVYPNKYRLNPNIPAGIEFFSDLAEPKMYWSRRLVETCRTRGIRGISAQTTYAISVETVEM